MMPDLLKRLPARWVQLAGIPELLAAAKRGRVEIVALEFGPLDVPRLDPAAQLKPVADIDEWIDVCAHFLEAPEEIDEGERVLEGLSRLCDQSPEDLAGPLGPLKKRINKLYDGPCGPFLGMSLRDDVCGVVQAWLTGQATTAKRKKNKHGNWEWIFSDRELTMWASDSPATALTALSQRSQELAERAARRNVRPLLSAATHAAGWLDPLAFAERLIAWQKLGEESPRFDAVLALLRLAPDHRAAARKQIGKLAGELPEAARYALGGDKPKIGKTAALWVAAARAREPRADDALIEKHFPELGPGAGTAARCEWRFRPDSHSYEGKTYHYVRFQMQISPPMPKRLASDLPTVLLHHIPKYASSGDSAEVRWQGTLWPAGREAAFVRGARVLADNLDWHEASWGNKTYLEPLLNADEPLTELGKLVLCLGLSAKEPGEHTLAADALAAAISDGRVDGRCLAPTLARLLTTGDIKPARWAKGLGGVARISPLHAHILRETVENTLAAAGKALADPPKDLHHLLELLLELLAERGAALTSQLARAALESIRGGGKAAKSAKAVLAATADESQARDLEVARAAIQGRLKRVRQWTERDE